MNKQKVIEAADLAILAEEQLYGFRKTEFPLRGEMFPLGQIAMNTKARNTLRSLRVLEVLAAHAHREWGAFGFIRGEYTDEPVEDHDTIISESPGRHGTRFFVITLLDLSVTVIFMPD